MQNLHERTLDRPQRFAIDDVLIELSHDSYDDSFEADAVNVGPGGLALRSALLPDVGSRLRCSFVSPLDGDRIAADCEVMWAECSGPRMGEFGLRFAEMDGASAESLQRLVDSYDGAWTDLPAHSDVLEDAEHARLDDDGEDEDDAFVTEDEAAHESDGAYQTLRLDGVASELVGEVAHEAGDVLVVEQELPFLRLGTGVTSEKGRRGTISSVDLRVEGDTPRLVLTVSYDETGVEHAYVDASDAPFASDLDTLPDPVLPAAVRAEAESTARSEPPLHARAAREPAAIERASAPAPRANERERDTPRSFRVAEREPVGSDALDASSPLARFETLLAAVRGAYVAALARIVPLFRACVAFVREKTKSFVEVAGPRVTETTTDAIAFSRRFATALRARLAETSAQEPTEPPRRVQRRRGAPEVEAAPARSTNPLADGGVKNALVLGFAALVVLLGLYGMLSGGSSAQTTAVPARVEAPVASPSSENEAAPGAEPIAVEATDAPSAPVAAAPSVTAAVPAPRALPEPNRAAGPIAAPTFPSMPGAGQAAPATAAPVVPPAPTTTFGAADVPNAIPFELTMSTTVSSIVGTVTPGGFAVRIPNTYSLSRAAPIAATHPYVDRAAITNLGDAAELRIDWKPGRNPPYRVEARGSKVFVYIGR